VEIRPRYPMKLTLKLLTVQLLTPLASSIAECDTTIAE
jgi:hypothetical protein